jgi:Zn finger protein HypA/HybF involved in hydrogenase expression
MSRNHATLQCPKCKQFFTADNLRFDPICPGCGYARHGDNSQPKFNIVENLKEEQYAEAYS